MTDKRVGIGVKATADFSQAKRDTQEFAEFARKTMASAGDAQSAGRPSVMQRMLGQGGGREIEDATRDMKALRDALDKTGQAGAKLRNVKLDTSQFSEAARELLNLQHNMDRLSRTAWGRDLRRRVRLSGQDIDRPFSWDFSRMGYRNAREAEIARRHAFGRLSGSAVSGHGAGFAGGIGVQALQGAGQWTLARARQAGGTVAALAGVSSIVGALVTGYREHLRTIESVDGAYKGLAAAKTFGDLRNEVKALGVELQMSTSEAAALAASFIRASGATDSFAVGRAQAAGQFGRGFGLNPTQTAGHFAQAELAGYGTTPRAQREFAGLLAHTIASSNMFARSEQVLGDLVGHIGEIAQREGRTVGETELGKFSALLGEMYLRNPAMKAGGAKTIMEGLKALGTGGGLIQDDFAWRALGPSVDHDYIKLERFKDASPFSSAKDIGVGDDTRTKFEHTWRRAREMAGWGLGSGANVHQKTAWILKQQTGMNMGAGEALSKIMEGFDATGDSFGEFTKWVEKTTGKDLEEVEPGAWRNLAEIYKERGLRIGLNGETPGPLGVRERALVEEYVAGDSISDTDRKALKEALAANDEAKIREMFPAIVARTSYVGTEADATREASAKLMDDLESLGRHVNTVVVGIKRFAGSVGDVDAMFKMLGGESDDLRDSFFDLRSVIDGILLVSGAMPWPMNIIGDSYEFSRDLIKFLGPAKSSPSGAAGKALGLPSGGLSKGQREIRDKIVAEMYRQGGSDEDAAVALGLAFHESKLGASMWGPKIKNPRSAHYGDRAYGPFQYMSKTARGWDRYDVDENIRHGVADLLRHKKSKGGYAGALAAHHAGPGAVNPDGTIRGNPRDANQSTRRFVDEVLKHAPRFLPDIQAGRKKRLEAREVEPIPITPPKTNEKAWQSSLLPPPRTQPSMFASSFDLASPEAYDEGPKLPQLHDRAIRAMGAQDPINARWQGQVALDFVFRDARGNVIKKQHGITVSEPRIAGSAGSYSNSNRFSWNDTVVLPG